MSKPSKKEFGNQRELGLPLTILSSILPPYGVLLCLYYWRPHRRKAQEALLAAAIGVPIAFVMGRYVMPSLMSLV